MDKIKCKKCKKTGHMAKQCQIKPCQTCGSYTHITKTCPEVKCSRCRELGHNVEECPKPPVHIYFVSESQITELEIYRNS